jgi:copper oxidase (laccase) domain-containing protein
MEKITFETAAELRLETYTKEAASFPSGENVTDFSVTALAHHPLVVQTADEVPFFFYDQKAHLIGAAKLSKDETLKEYLKTKMHEIMVQYNLQGEDIVVYLGPALTFSHTLVDRATLLKVMDMGYRASAKRTSGVDFFDVPVMNVLMLRKLGIPAANIFIDAHDTFECDSLLYSKLRGDKKENPSVIELLQ